MNVRQKSNKYKELVEVFKIASYSEGSEETYRVASRFNAVSVNKIYIKRKRKKKIPKGSRPKKKRPNFGHCPNLQTPPPRKLRTP